MECGLHCTPIILHDRRCVPRCSFGRKPLGRSSDCLFESIFVFLLERRFAMKFPTPLDDLATWRFFCLVGDPGSLLLEHRAPANNLFTEHP